MFFPAGSKTFLESEGKEGDISAAKKKYPWPNSPRCVFRSETSLRHMRPRGWEKLLCCLTPSLTGSKKRKLMTRFVTIRIWFIIGSWKNLANLCWLNLMQSLFFYLQKKWVYPFSFNKMMYGRFLFHISPVFANRTIRKEAYLFVPVWCQPTSTSIGEGDFASQLTLCEQPCLLHHHANSPMIQGSLSGTHFGGGDQTWCKYIYIYTRWWFQIFFVFTPIWGRFPFWLIFFKEVETTN